MSQSINLQSLERYISGPTHDDKESYLNALFDYAQKEGENKQKHKSTKDTTPPPRKKVLKENVNQNNAIIPFEANLDDDLDINNDRLVPPSQHIIQNQLRQAANVFQNASSSNCTINFQMPK